MPTKLTYVDVNSGTHTMCTAIDFFQIYAILALLLLNMYSGYSQPTHTIYSQFQTDSIIQLPFKERPIELQICFDGLKTYILDENASSNRILLRNVHNLFGDTLSIDFSRLDSLQKNNKSRVRSIAMNSKYVALAIFKTIFVFKRTKHTAQYLKSFKTRFSCDYLKIFDNALLAVSSKISNVDDENSASWLFRISMDDTTQNFSGIKLVEPIGVEFTYFAPQVHVAIHDSTVIVADIVNYNMRVYNHQGTLIDSFARNVPSWFSNRLYMQNSSVKDSIRSFLHYPRNSIELLRPYLDSIRMLRHIAIINDNELLVGWQLPERWVRQDGTLGPPKVSFDIWKYENRKWHIIDTDLTDILPQRSDSVVKWNNNTYLGFNYYTTNDALYRMNTWIPSSINASLLTYSDIYRIQDSLAEKGMAIFSLFMIKRTSKDSLMNSIEIRKPSNDDITIELDSLIGCDIRSTTTKLYSPDSTALVLLVNDYNCHDCIISALKAVNLSVQRSRTPIKVVLLTRTHQSTLSKIEAIKKIRKLSKQYEVLFDCANGDNDKWPPIGISNGVFGMLKVSKTPTLIIVNKNKKKYFIDYGQMSTVVNYPDKLSQQIDAILEQNH